MEMGSDAKGSSARRAKWLRTQATGALRRGVSDYRFQEKEAENRRRALADVLVGVHISLTFSFFFIYITKLMRAYYDTASMNPFTCLLTAALWGFLLLHLFRRPNLTRFLLLAGCILLTMNACFSA